MPPKTKRQRLSAEAAAVAREKLREKRLSDQGTDQSETAMNENSGPSSSSEGVAATPQQLLEQFSEEWVKTLDRDDKKSLAMFLCYNLAMKFNMKETETAGEMIGKSDRTVRQWKTDFVANNGEIPDGKQGKYQRSGVLWHNETLNKEATEYVRANSCVKGKPNMTSMDFCKWVNKRLLPNSTLEPGYLRKISVETARRWLHELGFMIITPKKGIFIDGHERDEYRKVFLHRLVKLGFLHFTNAPTESARTAIPTDIDPPTLEKRLKTVMLFHDESTFTANDDQPTKWGEKGEKMIKPKSKGAGIMVSDEHEGFLALSDEQYERAKATNPAIQNPYARTFLEYGEAREGYWTSEKFVVQMRKAVTIAECKYPKAGGWRHVWVFDHSSCHAAMAKDSLDANQMNVGEGGQQRVMHDTVYKGRVYKMNWTRRGVKVAKGMKQVLTERGINTDGKKADWMRNELASHHDFKDEKSMIEKLLVERGHICIMLPKFHPELNPIERVWAQLKRYTKAHCNYSLPSLRKNVPNAYDSVTLENIKKHFNKVRHYMFCYLEGLAPGTELDDTLKRYKTAVKSHTRIGVNE